MPELPEVETTVRGLQKKVLKRTFIDVWSDWEKVVKKPEQFETFRRLLKGRKILRIWRRAKNVIFELSGGHSLLIHQKMTGHLLVGKWRLAGRKWVSEQKGPFEEKINGFLHLILFLDNEQMIALSDYRKFAKAELWKTEELLSSPEFQALGPEPLEKSFTYEVFKKRLQKKRGKIKQVLMNPLFVAGIGNIYASEALWRAKIHPERNSATLSSQEGKELYRAIRTVLRAGIDLGGESFADYRNVEGEKGRFDSKRKVYQREGQPCSRCNVAIKRVMFGGRSAFYCPKCQPLEK